MRALCADDLTYLEHISLRYSFCQQKVHHWPDVLVNVKRTSLWDTPSGTQNTPRLCAFSLAHACWACCYWCRTACLDALPAAGCARAYRHSPMHCVLVCHPSLQTVSLDSWLCPVSAKSLWVSQHSSVLKWQDKHGCCARPDLEQGCIQAILGSARCLTCWVCEAYRLKKRSSKCVGWVNCNASLSCEREDKTMANHQHCKWVCPWTRTASDGRRMLSFS